MHFCNFLPRALLTNVMWHDDRPFQSSALFIRRKSNKTAKTIQNLLDPLGIYAAIFRVRKGCREICAYFFCPYSFNFWVSTLSIHQWIDESERIVFFLFFYELVLSWPLFHFFIVHTHHHLHSPGNNIAAIHSSNRDKRWFAARSAVGGRCRPPHHANSPAGGREECNKLYSVEESRSSELFFAFICFSFPSSLLLKERESRPVLFSETMLCCLDILHGFWSAHVCIGTQSSLSLWSSEVTTSLSLRSPRFFGVENVASRLI